MPDQPEDREAEVSRVTRSIVGRRGITAPPDVVERTVREQFGRYEGARVRDFVSLFVERAATAQLLQIQPAERPVS